MPFTALLALSLAANPSLDEGRALFQKLQYEQALVKLKTAAESSAPGAERREAYDLLARTWAALGDLKQAEAVYAQLLAKDPRAPAPTQVAPKIRAAYQSAKTSLFPPGTVRLTRVGGAERHLKLELFDPWGAVAKLELYEHDGKREKKKAVALKPALDVTLAPDTEQAWVAALGAKGEVLAGLGSRAKPLRFAGAARPPAAETEPPPSPSELMHPSTRAARCLAEGRDAEALQSVDVARKLGGLSRDEALELLGVEACAAARLGDGARAELAYRRAFALDPKLPAPDRCGEGWTAWFAARDAGGSTPLEFHALPLEEHLEATRATVVATRDPLGLAQSVRFHLRLASGWTETSARFQDGRASSEGPKGVVGWWAEVLGEGGTLATLGSATAPLSPGGEGAPPPPPVLTPAEKKEVPPPVVVEEPVEKPRHRWRWPVIGVFTGLGALSAMGAGFLGHDANADAATVKGYPAVVTATSQRDAFDLASKQRLEAGFANFFIVTASLFGAVALCVWLFASGGPLRD